MISKAIKNHKNRQSSQMTSPLKGRTVSWLVTQIVSAGGWFGAGSRPNSDTLPLQLH